MGDTILFISDTGDLVVTYLPIWWDSITTNIINPICDSDCMNGLSIINPVCDSDCFNGVKIIDLLK